MSPIYPNIKGEVTLAQWLYGVEATEEEPTEHGALITPLTGHEATDCTWHDIGTGTQEGLTAHKAHGSYTFFNKTNKTVVLGFWMWPFAVSCGFRIEPKSGLVLNLLPEEINKVAVPGLVTVTFGGFGSSPNAKYDSIQSQGPPGGGPGMQIQDP